MNKCIPGETPKVKSKLSHNPHAYTHHAHSPYSEQCASMRICAYLLIFSKLFLIIFLTDNFVKDKARDKARDKAKDKARDKTNYKAREKSYNNTDL